MQRLRMVAVARVTHAFHARVLAARLGSEGIVTQLRGAVDGPYPMGDVEVLVHAPDLDTAREILLADEVESAFSDLDGTGPDDLDDGLFDLDANPHRRRPSPWVVAVVVAVLVLFAYANTLAYRGTS